MKIFIVLLFMCPMLAFAQVKTHTVQAKESFSSIGRLYDVNGRVLAEYNNLNYEGGLSIGQVIKIPSSPSKPATTTTTPSTTPAAPVLQSPAPNTDGAPYLHTVGKKETLYHVSTLYPPATVAQIKKWNNLSGDGLSEGQVLIVGYGDEQQAVVTTKTITTIDDGTTKTVQVSEPQKTVTPNPPVMETATKPIKAAVTGGGYFASEYTGNENKDVQGTAGIFKSTSGWDDGKYYCLYNDARPGTIIKLTNPATDKFIYAKVLDVIPDLKQNKDVVIRLSNAAADVLGVSGSDFLCYINY